MFHTHFLFLMFAAISENTKCQMKVEDFLVKTRGFYSRTETSSQTSWQERLLVNAKYDHFIMTQQISNTGTEKYYCFTSSHVVLN